MYYDPRTQDHGLPHNPWTALIAPRPIGWVSTRSATGVANLAPYSFFNAAATHPPFVMLSSTPRKDSLTNIEQTGVFAINIVSADLAQAMSRSSAAVNAECDEFRLAGVQARACRSIDAPCVAQSPVVIECVLNRVVTLVPNSGLPCQTHITFGEVTGIEIADHVIRDGRVRTDLIQPVSRLGYLDYAITKDTFEILRPGG
ncbi:flavin reductase [Thioclava sp. SK-1]|uniref:flavin reductase family protein n=1 Tax=Thioclava sp. SK-1 TaxID=1889770 RepID=UPI000825047A|nr:flavin reductase family protein [Thioclava sp. SK-1]OCX58129.1 flavin reductase [Thioclava sp. SK-1]